MTSWDPSASQVVNSLIAGSGITLSPASGQGVVTVSSSGGGGGVTSLVAGTNIALTPSSGLGAVTVSQNYNSSVNFNSQYIYRNIGGSSAEQPVVFCGTNVATTTSPFTFNLPVTFADNNYIFMICTNGSSAGAVWSVTNYNSSTVYLSWTGGAARNVPFNYAIFGRGVAPP